MLGFIFSAFASAGSRPASPVKLGKKLVIAVLSGQSNMEGVNDRDSAVDTDHAGIFQYPSSGGFIGTPAVTPDITPLRHNDSVMRDGGAGNTGTTSWLSPGEYAARELVESGYADKVLLVPCARGSTPLVSMTVPTWNPNVSGSLHDDMIAQTQAAIAAARANTEFDYMTVEVMRYWVQGEKDGDNGETRAAYKALFEQADADFRSRVPQAANTRLVIGSMLPNYWMAGGSNYSALYDDINRGHVELMLADPAKRFYAIGADAPLPSPNGKHYAPLDKVREQGRRLTRIFCDNMAGPDITSTDTIGSSTGKPFALPLTSSAPFATFHIVGGADAGRFEISDSYASPTLRWSGNGTGPTSDGAYVVEIAARDGGHRQGFKQTVTVTATTAVAPSAVTFAPASTGAPATANSAGSANITFTGVQFQRGVGVLMLTCATRNIVGITVGGQAASLVIRSQAISGSSDVDYASIWQVPITTAGAIDVIVTTSGSSGSVAMSAGTLVGADPAVAATAIKAAGSVPNPASTDATLAIPTNGLGLAVARRGATDDFSWVTGVEIDEITNIDGIARHGTAQFAETDTPSFSAGSGYNGQAIAAAAWALAG